MAETKYGKYIITDPPRLQAAAGVTTTPRAFHNKANNKWTFAQPFLNKNVLAESPMHCDVVRVLEPPDPQPFINPHAHKVDEILLFLALGPESELGVDIEIELGREKEKHTFSRNTLIYIPKLMRHCPIYFNNCKKQFYMISVLLQPEYS